MATPQTLSDSPKAKQPMGTEEGFESRAAGWLYSPEEASAHVSAIPNVYASHSICVTANCTSRAKLNILVGSKGARAQSRAKDPGERRGTPTHHDGHRAGAGRDPIFSSSLPGPCGRRQSTNADKESLRFSLAMAALPGASAPVPPQGCRLWLSAATSRLGDLRKPLALAFRSVS